MPKTRYRMFIDDTGNTDAKTSNDPTLRFGSISAVIFERQYLDHVFDKSFCYLVEKHFGTKEDGSPVSLHRRVLASPPEKGPFSVLRDPEKRIAWDTHALSMFNRAQFHVITVSVDKVAFYYHNPDWRGDFYELLVTNAVERFYYFLRNKGTGDVLIEEKNVVRDQALKTHFRNAIDKGFRFISAEQLQQVFESKEIKIESKKSALPGLQMADLIAGPSFSHCHQTYGKRRDPLPDFSAKVAAILENSKYYRSDSGNPDGYGRIWRPSQK